MGPGASEVRWGERNVQGGFPAFGPLWESRSAAGGTQRRAEDFPPCQARAVAARLMQALASGRILTLPPPVAFGTRSERGCPQPQQPRLRNGSPMFRDAIPRSEER